jgi:lipopolysaccharide transport system ATP-binding protein
VEGVSKQYRIGTREKSYETLRDALAGVVRAPLRKVRGLAGGRVETVWALKDVTFEVEPGEVVGIVGPNGAGKSTLLKILSRVTEPTEGRISLYGRVGSLLEVGTGFHPELTGRENICLNGAILGMSRAEISRKLDEIIAFSEIEKFIDTPVKRYSSGMYTRLAFAVAAHLEPEILIVDEVLAVGDASFQKKCLGKMGDVSREGRTVLFVSHNMAALRSLCRKAIWLDGGKVAAEGEAGRVIDLYLQKGSSLVQEKTWDDPSEAPGDDRVRLRHASVAAAGHDDAGMITVETPLRLDLAFWNYLPNAALNFSVVLYNTEGVAIFNTGSGSKVFPVGTVRGSFVIPGNFLNDGVYLIRLLIVKDSSSVLLDINDLLRFEVHDIERTGTWYGKWVGAVRPKFDWSLRAG